MARHEDNDFQEQRPEPFVASQPKKHSGLASIITLLIVLMVFVAGLWGYFYFTSSTGKRVATETFNYVAKPVQDLYYFITQQTRAAGTSFYSTDSSNTNEEYGIKFVNFQSVSSKRIPAGSMASFKYVVKVGSGVENINLNLDCKVDPKDVVKGDISKIPKDTLKVSTENPDIANNLRCNFLTNDQITEDKTVTVKGLMSFSIPVQRASLKVYLLGSKEYEDLKGKDFFVVNNKPDKLPIKATYSGEPIELGIGVSEDLKQPVVVGPDYSPLVGISLINKWDGKVTSVDSLSLILPEGISIDDTLTPPSELCPFSEGIPYNKVVKYEADKDLLKNIAPFGSGEIINFQNFECRLKVDDRFVEGRKAGFETAYHVDLGYSYSFNEKSDVITVSKRQTSTQTPSPEPPNISEEVVA